MKSQNASGVFKSLAILAVLLLFLGLMAFWSAPILGQALVAILVTLLWCGFLYFMALLIRLWWSFRSLKGGRILPLNRVMALRRQLLLIYTSLESLLPKGFKRQVIQQRVIDLNNQLLDAAQIKVAGGDILVLTPRCIQRSKCGIRVTGLEEDNHCTQCGLCAVGDLKAFKDQYGISVAIATGGTLARKILSEKRPAVVIAIACERDLISGLKDALTLPVYGLYNQRPKGPCADTTFDKNVLDALIRKVLLIF